MNTVDRIKQICKDRKIAISKLEKDCGFSNGYIGQLKKGTVPDNRLKAIANYLDVTVDYLLGSENYEYDKNTKTWDYIVSKKDQVLIEKIMLDADLSKRLIAYAEKLAQIIDEDEKIANKKGENYE